MASTDGRPIPKKNTAYRVTFPIFDADGDTVPDAAGLDSEVSKDAGAFADCTNEATQIAASSGMYYLDLTDSEMNADTVAIIVKTSTSGAKTTPIVTYPVTGGIKEIYSDTTIIYSDTTVIHSETTAIQTDTGNIYSDTTIIYSDTTAIHSETTVIQTDTGNIHSDTTIIASDVIVIDAALSNVHSETTAIQTDTGNIYSDTTIIYSDTTAIHSETTAIQTDTGNIYSDTTIIYSDTTEIHSETTVILSDTTAIEIDTGTDGVAISQTVQQAVADEILKRGISNVEDAADATSLAALILAAFESTIVDTTWTIRKTGGTTFATKTATLDATASPITGVT